MNTVQAPPQRRRWRPRFSLRALFCWVLLLASAGSVWRRWEPWVPAALLLSYGDDDNVAARFSPDGTWLSVDHIDTNLTFSLAGGTPQLQHKKAIRTVCIGTNSVSHCTLAERFSTWSAGNNLAISHQLFTLGAPKPFFDTTIAQPSRFIQPQLRPDGRHFIYPAEPGSTQSREFIVFDCAMQKETAELAFAAPRKLRYSGDSRRLIVFDGGAIVVLNAETYTEVMRVKASTDIKDDPSHRVDSIVVDDSGRYVKLNASFRSYLYDMDDGGKLIAQKHGLQSTAVAVDPFIFVEHDDRLVRLDTSPRSLARYINIPREGKIGAPDLIDYRGSDAAGARLLMHCEDRSQIWDAKTLQPLYGFDPDKRADAFSRDGNHIAIAHIADHTNQQLYLYERRRPEQWWGIAWLPESWLALIFFVALLLCLRADWQARG